MRSTVWTALVVAVSVSTVAAASAAVAPGRLHIRGERHLFAIGSGT